MLPRKRSTNVVYPCTRTWPCIHKAVHTQAGAYTKGALATASVLMLKGGQGLPPASSEARSSSSEASRSEGRFGGPNHFF